MRVYANLLAPHRVRVNPVHPSGVDTPMINNEFPRRWIEEIAGGPDKPQDLTNALPVPVLSIEMISPTPCCGSCPTPRYVTGVTLPVDAGFTVKR